MNILVADGIPDSAELQLAQHLLARLAQRGTPAPDLVHSWIKPAAHVGGDGVAIARTPTNELNVLFSDAAGHGLAAVVSALPLIDTFYSMCEKGFSLPSIARELNRKAHYLLPADRFLAAVIVSVNFEEKAIRLWSGGAPAVRYVTHQGMIERVWNAAHPALGVLSDDAFDSTTQAYRWQAPGDIMLFSDSLPHLLDAKDAVFGMPRILELIQRPGDLQRVHTLVDAVQQHIGDTPQQDDISIVSVRCDSAPTWRETQHQNVAEVSTPSGTETCWRLQLTLGATQIRQLDTLPLIINWLDQLQIAQQHRGQVFLVLGELLNNALDHGLLHLESGLKQAHTGFEDYIVLREARLAALHDATIDVALECFKTNGKTCLRIAIRDSGPGFDHAATLGRRAAEGNEFSGRGLMLVQRLCQSLTYSERGNEVSAVYVLD